jgi:hypothetical protein
MLSFKRLISLILFAGLITFFSCKVVTDKSAQKSLSDLCFSSGTITGWNTAADNSCQMNGTVELYNDIDGGAPTYIDHGFIQYIKQDLSGSAGKTASVRVMDFGTADKAKVMYEDILTSTKINDELPAPGYDRTVAVMSAAIGTFSVYAHFDRFYFELIFSEMDGTADANNNAGQFLKTYQAKLK